jgi:hypothetical protein
LSLGAVALVRSVDSGTLVLGNLGFKQETAASAERATQSAIAWLSANSATLDNNANGGGYYATANDNLDPTGQLDTLASRVLVNWNNDSCAYAKGTTTGLCTLTPTTVVTAGANQPVTLRYVIFRLCSTTGSPTAAGNVCARPAAATAGNANDKGGLDYSKPSPLTGQGVGTYYRIVVQATGARDTAAITETIVQF